MMNSPDITAGSPENDQSSENIAISIAQKLGLGIEHKHKQWESHGEIYLDFNDKKQASVEKGILEAQAESAIILNEALANEAEIRGGGFKSFDEYLKYLEERDFLKYGVNEGVLAALKSGLVSHWNKVKTQIKRGSRGIRSWEDFRMNSLSRATKYRTLFYTEELEKDADIELKYGIAINDLESQRNYFTTPYLTHTVHSSTASSIVSDGAIKSEDRNNFSVSSIVVRVARINGNITFIFDGHDLLRAMPFVHGRSRGMYENEVTTHFPASLCLARAVIPTDIILNLHQTPKHKSKGTISQRIDPSLIIVSD